LGSSAGDAGARQIVLGALITEMVDADMERLTLASEP